MITEPGRYILTAETGTQIECEVLELGGKLFVKFPGESLIAADLFRLANAQKIG